MSEETASSIDGIEVYVPLLGEGTAVNRPTLAIHQGGSTYELLATDDYDPEDETWQFPPGQVVECCSQTVGDREILLACRPARNV